MPDPVSQPAPQANRHAIGAKSAHSRAASGGIVGLEGGGQRPHPRVGGAGSLAVRDRR
jgi:hypothetical protein